MKMATILQSAVVAVLLGVMLLLLGLGGVEGVEQQRPTSTRSWRAATPEERRQYERDQLVEALEQARLDDILDQQVGRP